MASTTRTLAAGAAVAGVLVLLYSLLVLHQPLVGVGIAFALFVAAVLLHAGGADRRTVAGVTMAVTVVYGVFTLQLPAAVVAACVVYLTAWVTSPDGPFDAAPPELFAATVEGDAATAEDDAE
ncbi:hypothetical protein [Halobacterium zhouii]|uniref:hypothetical protein n=1 Tax=Halobacterium zhouii TaxID=2902624 RepID=UPI001E552D50|nr:hypothetical protein [Halobacterium zhouii]